VRPITLSLAMLLLGSWSLASAAEKPTRIEIFERLEGPDASASPAPEPPPPTTVPPAPPAPHDPHQPLILPEVRHDVTITGKLTPGLRLDLELQYLSTNKFRDVLIGGIGWVKEPIPKMLRPGVTYKPDGTYEIKFGMFNSSWLNGRFQMHYARIAVLERGYEPAYFDLRADTPGAPGMMEAKSISVAHQHGAHGNQLSCDVVTPAGPAPHRVLALPTTPGWTSYTIDVKSE